ncbi:MAG: hypothetical protein H6813_00435 [Phycisphaeraceae bacterium]|nr:hypothetical protein [Phycisphaeraceae bacterium]MCB9847448.1 hypothetical protein [Phycisphaeraceae bacterium]
MSHASSSGAGALLKGDNITAPKGSTLSMGLLGLGVICCAITLFMAFMNIRSEDAAAHLTGKQALAAFHIGFIITLGISLGALVFVMILHQVGAGWSALIRRQLEHLMAGIFPSVLLLAIPTVFAATLFVPGELFHWMDGHVHDDPIYQAKSAFLNVNFFLLRAVIYFAVWTGLSVTLYRQSLRQDATGDRWITARSRRLSSIGIVLFALTTAFAAFDWMMSLDYHWFSTMFGVYFFAGFAAPALGMLTLVLVALRRAGKLHGLVTDEHLHDLGKLMFGFVVFWGYIGFSQYFLIWYANIPEETSWFIRRRTDLWGWVAVALVWGRFVIPFILLMNRAMRRNPAVLSFVSVWLMLFFILDIYFVVRPEARVGDDGGALFTWLDAVGILGPILLFLGFLIRRIASSPLIPVNDPRLAESVGHKNFI